MLSVVSFFYFTLYILCAAVFTHAVLASSARVIAVIACLCVCLCVCVSVCRTPVLFINDVCDVFGDLKVVCK